MKEVYGETRLGSLVDNRPFTDQLHHFVLPYAKPEKGLEWDKAATLGQDLDWDKAVMTWTREEMGY